MKLHGCEQQLHGKINSLLSMLAEHHNCNSHVLADANIMRSGTINADDPELIQAAGTGDLERVFSLLYCEEVNPNITNVSGITPLLQATLDTQENLNIVELRIPINSIINSNNIRAPIPIISEH